MKNHARSWRLAAVCFAMLVMASARDAGAGVLTEYTDLSSFQAATSGLTEVTFGGIAPSGSFTSFRIPTGYTDATTGTRITVTNGAGGDMNVTAANYYVVNFGSPLFPADFLVPGAGTGGSDPKERITLPGNVTAIGLEYSTGNQQSFTYTLSNGDSLTEPNTPAFGNVSFIGFTDTVPFGSLTVSSPGDVLFLTSIRYSAIAPTPEPSALALTGLAGLALLGRVAWRRRRF
jgi:hypothetical protein